MRRNGATSGIVSRSALSNCIDLSLPFLPLFLLYISPSLHSLPSSPHLLPPCLRECLYTYLILPHSAPTFSPMISRYLFSLSTLPAFLPGLVPCPSSYLLSLSSHPTYLPPFILYLSVLLPSSYLLSLSSYPTYLPPFIIYLPVPTSCSPYLSGYLTTHIILFPHFHLSQVPLSPNSFPPFLPSLSFSLA